MDAIYRHPDLYALLSEHARAHDLPFYTGLARGRPARSVLEYGVGAGRVAIPLARAGLRVVGVDRAQPMLERLQERLGSEEPEVRARVTARCGDACELHLGERFDLVLVPFNGLAEILAEGRGALFFARVREHLAPDGAFAFDVLLPDPRLHGGLRSTTPWLRDLATGALSRCEQAFDYDAATGVLRVTTEVRGMDVETPSRVFSLEQRQLSPDEVPRLLSRDGFEIVWRSATFALPRGGTLDALPDEPPDDWSDAVAYVCTTAP